MQACAVKVRVVGAWKLRMLMRCLPLLALVSRLLRWRFVVNVTFRDRWKRGELRLSPVLRVRSEQP